MQLHTPRVQPNVGHMFKQYPITQHCLIYNCACLASKPSAVMSPHPEPSSSRCLVTTAVVTECWLWESLEYHLGTSGVVYSPSKHTHVVEHGAIQTHSADSEETCVMEKQRG